MQVDSPELNICSGSSGLNWVYSPSKCGAIILMSDPFSCWVEGVGAGARWHNFPDTNSEEERTGVLVLTAKQGQQIFTLTSSSQITNRNSTCYNRDSFWRGHAKIWSWGFSMWREQHKGYVGIAHKNLGRAPTIQSSCGLQNACSAH